MLDSGVYLIRNRKTGASYVGASERLRHRIREHVRRATGMTKPSQQFDLYAAFSGCTVEDIEILILERVHADVLEEREQFWIRVRRPSLNWVRPSPSKWLLPASDALPEQWDTTRMRFNGKRVRQEADEVIAATEPRRLRVAR